MDKLLIPVKLPSTNQYINECRKNKYVGSNMKRKIEKEISYKLPEYNNPIKIHFFVD